MTALGDATRDDDVRRWRALALLAGAELLGMSLWFAASAVAPQLAVRWELSSSETAWLTTSVQLGFLPLLEAGLVDAKHLIADCKSGVSGAGRKAELALAFAEASDNFAAYAVAGHRHAPEIVQGLNRASRDPVRLVFTPHLTPMVRGIFATLYAPLRDRDADLQKLYENRYAGEPFVDVMPAGSLPDTRSVRASNMLRIAVHRPPDSDLAVVLAVEDNLVKGAAGQAIQNMNLMFGLPETAGLMAPPVLP